MSLLYLSVAPEHVPPLSVNTPSGQKTRSDDIHELEEKESGYSREGGESLSRFVHVSAQYILPLSTVNPNRALLASRMHERTPFIRFEFVSIRAFFESIVEMTLR